tara:strand:- start:22173 stop:22391 length:219 start_codon:yes stop_codon:yes gene_type:complete
MDSELGQFPASIGNRVAPSGVQGGIGSILLYFGGKVGYQNIIDSSSQKYFKPKSSARFLKIITDIIDSKIGA